MILYIRASIMPTCDRKYTVDGERGVEWSIPCGAFSNSGRDPGIMTRFNRENGLRGKFSFLTYSIEDFNIPQQ
jgi:hypothetical protein